MDLEFSFEKKVPCFIVCFFNEELSKGNFVGSDDFATIEFLSCRMTLVYSHEKKAFTKLNVQIFAPICDNLHSLFNKILAKIPETLVKVSDLIMTFEELYSKIKRYSFTIV